MGRKVFPMRAKTIKEPEPEPPKPATLAERRAAYKLAINGIEAVGRGVEEAKAMIAELLEAERAETEALRSVEAGIAEAGVKPPAEAEPAK